MRRDYKTSEKKIERRKTCALFFIIKSVFLNQLSLSHASLPSNIDEFNNGGMFIFKYRISFRLIRS